MNIDEFAKPTFAVPEGFSFDQKKADELKADLAAKGVQYLLSTYVDIHGVPKAKVNPIECLDKMAGGSELFTVGAMEGMGLVGPQEDECAAVPDLDTAIVCPWDKRFAYFFGDLYYHGAPYVNDSRQILKRQIERAAALGLKLNLGVEPEFYVLKQDDSGNWKEEKDYMQGLDPMEVHQNNFLLQAERILDGLEGKECDLATLEEAKLNLKVVFAAKQSWQEKKIIPIE